MGEINMVAEEDANNLQEEYKQVHELKEKKLELDETWYYKIAFNCICILCKL